MSALEQPRYCSAIETPLGKIFATATDEAVTGLYFEGQKYFPENLPAHTGPNPVLRQLDHEITEYFAGTRGEFNLRLQPRGTEFQQGVWALLLQIPAGATISYGDLAQQMQRPSATRAVANAVGRNPISILIPCHRIIGKDGSLTGYAGGIERKAALLNLEARP